MKDKKLFFFSKSGFFSLLLVVFLAPGCGPGGATVSGKVTYKGEALTGGRLVLFSDKKVIRANIGSDGSFKAEGVPPGTVKIALDIPKPINIPFPEKAKPPKDKTIPGATKDPYDFLSKKGSFPEIPDRLRDPEKSGITITVSAGQQTQDIEVK